MHYIGSYLRGSDTCQLHKIGATPQRQFENRINLNYTSMNKLSHDIKYMYRVSAGHIFILMVVDEVKNYLVTIPLLKGTFYEIGEALINNVFCKHGPPHYLIFDQDQTFLSSVMQCVYRRLRYSNQDHKSI